MEHIPKHRNEYPNVDQMYSRIGQVTTYKVEKEIKWNDNKEENKNMEIKKN